MAKCITFVDVLVHVSTPNFCHGIQAIFVNVLRFCSSDLTNMFKRPDLRISKVSLVKSRASRVGFEWDTHAPFKLMSFQICLDITLDLCVYTTYIKFHNFWSLFARFFAQFVCLWNNFKLQQCDLQVQMNWELIREVYKHERSVWHDQNCKLVKNDGAHVSHPDVCVCKFDVTIVKSYAHAVFWSSFNLFGSWFLYV